MTNHQLDRAMQAICNNLARVAMYTLHCRPDEEPTLPTDLQKDLAIAHCNLTVVIAHLSNKTEFIDQIMSLRQQIEEED